MDGRLNVEAQIRAAQERGDFDDLPGKGKPLDLPVVYDPDWWVKSYLRREGIDTSALVHPTLALRREAGGFPESLAVLTHEDQVRAVLEDFNRRVVAEWRRVMTGPSLPVVAQQVAVEPMIERWRALRAEIEGAETERAEESDRSAPARSQGGWRRLTARLTSRRSTARSHPPAPPPSKS